MDEIVEKQFKLEMKQILKKVPREDLTDKIWVFKSLYEISEELALKALNHQSDKKVEKIHIESLRKKLTTLNIKSTEECRKVFYSGKLVDERETPKTIYKEYSNSQTEHQRNKIIDNFVKMKKDMQDFISLFEEYVKRK